MLTHSDAIVELLSDTQRLIRGCIARPDECRIVRTDFGNVAILSAAKFRIVVTGLRVDRRRARHGPAGGL